MLRCVRARVQCSNDHNCRCGRDEGDTRNTRWGGEKWRNVRVNACAQVCVCECVCVSVLSVCMCECECAGGRQFTRV